jgi:hypothetical protein
MANLVKNYSPHIKPDVEKASATSELNTALLERARDMLDVFLRTWRRERMEERHRTGQAHPLGPVRLEEISLFKGHTDAMGVFRSSTRRWPK